MTFTQLYGSVLAPFIKMFKEAKNEQGRKTVITNAADAVKKAKDLLEEVDDLPKDLQTVCIPSHSLPFWTNVSGFRL
jgi:hypothetical protein